MKEWTAISEPDKSGIKKEFFTWVCNSGVIEIFLYRYTTFTKEERWVFNCPSLFKGNDISLTATSLEDAKRAAMIKVIDCVKTLNNDLLEMLK